MYVINEQTKIVNIWADTEINRKRLLSGKYGVVEYRGEVEQGYDGTTYAKGYAPEKPEPTKEEVRQTREALYRGQKDPITCQIQSLRDEEETEEILAEIEALKVKRAEIVAKIKEENPYPEENE